MLGIRLNKNSEQRGHLHVVSIGTDNLMLEVWADVSSDRLLLKLRRSDGKTNEILAESVTESVLPPGQWHHLALNVHDYIQRKKSVIEVAFSSFSHQIFFVDFSEFLISFPYFTGHYYYQWSSRNKVPSSIQWHCSPQI